MSTTTSFVPDRVAARLMSNYVINENGCWISGYSSASHGYSQIGWHEDGQRKLILGHRGSWMVHYGEIPKEMTVDHTCHVRKCINPAHLRLLSNFENSIRNAPDKDFPLGWICKRNHSSSSQAERSRKAKSGRIYSGLICLECEKMDKNRKD